MRQLHADRELVEDPTCRVGRHLDRDGRDAGGKAASPTEVRGCVPMIPEAASRYAHATPRCEDQGRGDRRRRLAPCMFPILILSLYTLTALIFYCAMSKDYKPIDVSAIRLAILVLILPVLVKYLVHLLIAPWYSAVESFRSRRRPLGFRPSVSVLIPAWNEEVGILTTISSVIRTEYPIWKLLSSTMDRPTAPTR